MTEDELMRAFYVSCSHFFLCTLWTGYDCPRLWLMTLTSGARLLLLVAVVMRSVDIATRQNKLGFVLR